MDETKKMIFSPKEIFVKKEGKVLHRRDLARLNIDDLLNCEIKVKGIPVNVEKIGDDVRFVWQGADFNRRYKPHESAVDLLAGVYDLARYYNPAVGELTF